MNEQRMHLAHFTNTYHPVVNGVVRSVSMFKQALTDLGHNVFVFAQVDQKYQDQEPFVFRYPSIRIPIEVDIPAVIPLSPFVDRLLPRLRPNVIHTHHPILLGQAGASKARELELPLVFTFHTQYREYSHYFPIPQEDVQDFVKNFINRWLIEYMQRCHHIVVPSEGMLQILRRDYGLRSRYSIIPTGIDLEHYQSAEDDWLRKEKGWEKDVVMISVGRLAREKNWRTLLDAAAITLQDHPSLRVVIIGKGPDRDALIEYTRQLGIASRVEFTGELPFSEVPSYLGAADLFGFASVTETQGLVTMEAIAAGLPVVAVEATGTRDIVQNDREGLLTENDSSALAEAIHKLLSDPERMRRYRAAALERAKEFDIHNLAKKLLDVYQRAGEDQKAGRFVDVER